MGSRYRHLCPYGSPAYLHSSFRRGAGLVSPATTSADSATLARVDEFLMNSRRNFVELRHGEVRRMPSSEKSCSRTLAEYSSGRKGTANLVAGRGRVPACRAGKGEPDYDAASVVIRHPDEDAYFARQTQWRAGVAHRGPGRLPDGRLGG